ncbi:MAG: hypothetical protein CMJ79_11235 [Planctomycetaceae bacterium]|nr:hypothetical protein [Planctomycetaceae bacterium]
MNRPEFMPCNRCGVLTSNTDSICAKCSEDSSNPYAAPFAKEALASQSNPDGPAEKPDLGMRILLPVGRSGHAIIAGYMGLFSLLLLPGPFALLFGILAVKDIKMNPEKSGMGRAIFGIVAGFFATVMLGFVILGFYVREL